MEYDHGIRLEAAVAGDGHVYFIDAAHCAGGPGRGGPVADRRDQHDGGQHRDDVPAAAGDRRGGLRSQMRGPPCAETATTKTADVTMDRVNSGLSPLRQWILQQLRIAIPNNQIAFRSNDPKTMGLFEHWTGYTQAKLEKRWKEQGFEKTNTDGCVWTRATDGPVETSCNALVGKVVNKAKDAGFAKGMPPGRKRFGTFDVPGVGFYGKETAKTPGWNWYFLKSSDHHPRPGDIFQVGTRVKPDQSGHGACRLRHHVGRRREPEVGDRRGGPGRPLRGL